jgi:hypothetical protein
MAFGATVDHLGFAVANELLLVSSSKTARAKTRADANDENGDPGASTWFGQATPVIYDVECEYELVAGADLDIASLVIGAKETNPVSGRCASSLRVTTSNGAVPRIAVSGMLGALDVANMGTWAPPSITIYGRKQAQVLGFTVTAGCKLTGSSFELSLDEYQTANGVGTPTLHSLSGAVARVTADFVEVTVAPAWTVTLSGLTEVQPPGSDTPGPEYPTGQGVAEIIVARVVV